MPTVILANFFYTLLLLTNQLCAENTIYVNSWYYLGPFSIGPREGIIGIDLDIQNEAFVPDTNRSYPSILANGGFIRWQCLKTDNGEAAIEYKDVLWDTIQDYYGVAGVLCATIAYGEFECDKKMRALISAKNIGSFILNGKNYPGDVYGDGYVQIPVILNSGKTRIVLLLTGYAQHRFSFAILPCADSLMIIKKDIILPDIIKNNPCNYCIGVPIINTTEFAFRNLKVEVFGDAIERTESEIKRLMPLSVIKIPVALKSESRFENDSVMIRFQVHNDEVKISDSCWIMVRNPDEPHKKTFISKIDSSCQYYAVLFPENFNPEEHYALLMSCHGASVEVINQVKSYSKKDWAFVVAPTNRRRFGFDWQDWGRLDFLEVLEDVKKNFKIDTNRIYLTGHSMGGHGAWHIGLAHPDLFAAIAPSAGWTSFQLYLPWFLQKSELFAQPDQIKFRDMVLREDITPLFLENALNVPIYILHGSADDNVPPIQARIMAHHLTNLNYDFVYKEIEGKKHWWDIDTAPGVDCVDLKEMIEFLKNKKRNSYPKKVVFRTNNIAQSNKAYWIKIDEIEDIYREAWIKAEMLLENEDEAIQMNGYYHATYLIECDNVSRFTIILRRFRRTPDFILFEVNGERAGIVKYQNQEKISFYKKGDRFKIGDFIPKSLYKEPKIYGPVKQAYFTPFILVYGTIGDSIDTENNLHQARLQVYNWWIRANGYTEIVPDTEITEVHIRNFNLILFGNVKTNSLIKRINKKLLINFTSNSETISNNGISEIHIAVKDEILSQKDLCMIQIYPNPLNPQKFVVLYSSTTKEANKYLGLFNPLYSGSGLPDFIIWDKSASKYGWAGIAAAGFFDKEWQVHRTLMFIK